MERTVLAADVSNYQPTFAANIQHYISTYNLGGLIVRLPLPYERDYPTKRRIALEQIEAGRNAGLRTEGYVWAYWHEDPEDAVHASLGLYPDCPRLWIDAEDSPVGPSEITDWLLRACSAGARLTTPVGLYTAKWWYDSAGLPDRRLNFMPLWFVDIDGQNADIDTWPINPFGGWVRPVAKQWAFGESHPSGIDLDTLRYDDAAAPADDSNAAIVWNYLTSDVPDQLALARRQYSLEDPTMPRSPMSRKWTKAKLRDHLSDFANAVKAVENTLRAHA